MTIAKQEPSNTATRDKALSLQTGPSEKKKRNGSYSSPYGYIRAHASQKLGKKVFYFTFDSMPSSIKSSISNGLERKSSFRFPVSGMPGCVSVE